MKKVIYCGRRIKEYSRDEAIFKALKMSNIHFIDYSVVTDDKYIKKYSIYMLKSFFLQVLIFARILKILNRDTMHYFFVNKGNHIILLLLGIFRKILRLRIYIIFDAWVCIVGSADVARFSKLNILLRRIVERLCHRIANRIIVLSEEYKDFFVKLYNQPEEKYRIVPLSVREEWLDYPVDCRREETFTVTYWGGFLGHHGVEILLEAAKRLKEIQFVLIGEGPLKKKVIDTINRYELGNVIYKGKLPLYELIKEVDRANVAVGHLKHEHDADLILPNKALEAMARGKVVISVKSSFVVRQYGESFPVVFFDGSIEGFIVLLKKLKEDMNLVKVGNCGKDLIIKYHSQEEVNKAINSIIEELV